MKNMSFSCWLRVPCSTHSTTPRRSIWSNCWKILSHSSRSFWHCSLFSYSRHMTGMAEIFTSYRDSWHFEKWVVFACFIQINLFQRKIAAFTRCWLMPTGHRHYGVSQFQWMTNDFLYTYSYFAERRLSNAHTNITKTDECVSISQGSRKIPQGYRTVTSAGSRSSSIMPKHSQGYTNSMWVTTSVSASCMRLQNHAFVSVSHSVRLSSNLIWYNHLNSHCAMRKLIVSKLLAAVSASPLKIQVK